MKRYLIIVALFLYSLNCVSQKKCNCSIVDTILTNKKLANWIGIYSHSGDCIAIIDSNNFFKGCTFSDHNNRKVIFSYDLNKYNYTNVTFIIIEVTQKKHNIFTVIVRPNHPIQQGGRIEFITYKKKRNGVYKMKQYSIGDL